VFRPDAHGIAHSQLTAFGQWCEARTGQQLRDHAAMDRFSVEDFHSFWRLFLEWSDVPRDGAAEPVCVGDACETARFFPDIRLNYAECLLAGSPGQPVLTACHADGSRDRFTRGALRGAVGRLARSLQRLGVRPGDHVVAIARNNAAAVIACLATAAIGATFASCAPDMGVPAILARFAPLEPVVLFGCLRAERWDAGIPVAERVLETAAGLPSLAAIIALVVRDVALPAAVARVKASLPRYSGYAETLAAMSRAEALAAQGVPEAEAVVTLGEGWVAEEALAIALLCALAAPDYETGVRLAVNHDGDSDSTAAIAGNLLGAMHGIDAIPRRWLIGIELKRVITEMADDLATFVDWPIGEFVPDSDEADYWKRRYPGR